MAVRLYLWEVQFPSAGQASMSRSILRLSALVALAAGSLACDSGTEPDGPAAADIDLIADVDVLPAGQSRQLLTVVEDAAGNLINDARVTYTSSSQNIATVNGTGRVTGMGDGTVTITATSGTVSDEVTLYIYDFVDLCDEALGLTVGEDVRASLQPGDCDELVGDGSYVDLWYFDLAQQREVTIDMTSDDMDTYLWLVDEEGIDVDEDDNNGAGDNARIQRTLAAGTYFVLAGHWPNEDGAYTLSVTAGTALDAAGALRLRGERDGASRAAPSVGERRR